MLIVLIILSTYQACSPVPGWVPATIDEQFSLAGIVFVGRVIESTQSLQGLETSATVRVETYLKGCGPRIVKVNGYTNSAMCGITAPDRGSRIIVFGCVANRNSNEVDLNNFTISTGTAPVGPEVRSLIRDYRKNSKGSKICRAFEDLSTCGKRDN